jgi:hypothetical protein
VKLIDEVPRHGRRQQVAAIGSRISMNERDDVELDQIVASGAEKAEREIREDGSIYTGGGIELVVDESLGRDLGYLRFEECQSDEQFLFACEQLVIC